VLGSSHLADTQTPIQWPLFQDNQGKLAPERFKLFWILITQETMWWQWHQLDHMQIICNSLQTDNHANTSSLECFYRLNALPDAQPTASKH